MSGAGGAVDERGEPSFHRDLSARLVDNIKMLVDQIETCGRKRGVAADTQTALGYDSGR